MFELMESPMQKNELQPSRFRLLAFVLHGVFRTTRRTSLNHILSLNHKENNSIGGWAGYTDPLPAIELDIEDFETTGAGL